MSPMSKVYAHACTQQALDGQLGGCKACSMDNSKFEGLFFFVFHRYGNFYNFEVVKFIRTHDQFIGKFITTHLHANSWLWQLSKLL